jgi:hypothetical protein
MPLQPALSTACRKVIVIAYREDVRQLVSMLAGQGFDVRVQRGEYSDEVGFSAGGGLKSKNAIRSMSCAFSAVDARLGVEFCLVQQRATLDAIKSDR